MNRCGDCSKNIPLYAMFCPYCGNKIESFSNEKSRKKSRGNGQGTAIKVSVGNWRAVATIGYDENGRLIRRSKQGFPTKSDALSYISILKKEKCEEKYITLKAAYDFYMKTFDGSKSTRDCYNAGFKIFQDAWYYSINKQDIDDLQDMLDESGKGKRTMQLGKIALGLVYKWAIPRGYVQDKVNLAEFLKVHSDDEKPSKHSFTTEQLCIITKAIGTVPIADFIYCNCYLGFRPTELLDLKMSDLYNNDYFIGGIKTDAGKNRKVPISDKIKPFIEKLCNGKSNDDYIFSETNQRMSIGVYRERFYTALDTLGIQPYNDHKLTPHCCRHTFATMLKNINAPDKDKLKLIGHTDIAMLQYYQDVDISDLKNIIDKL